MDAINEARIIVWKEQHETFFDQAIIDVDGVIVATTAECKKAWISRTKGAGYTIHCWSAWQILSKFWPSLIAADRLNELAICSVQQVIQFSRFMSLTSGQSEAQRIPLSILRM
jgi:hypothetical protein